MSFFRSKAGHEAVALIGVGGAIWGLGANFDVFEKLSRLVAQYDSYQLDDVLLAASVTGLVSLIYSARRVHELRREIDRRKHAEQDAEWMSGHDETTRLLNRRSLQQRIGCAGESGSVGIISFELHGFNKIKDLFDHQAADDVLREMAERLKQIFAYQNVFRTGGREFVALIDRNGEPDMAAVAEKLVAAVARPVIVNGQAMDISISAGHATFPDDGASMSDVLRCAEVAMEAAKNDPFKTVRVFEGKMRERWQERTKLEKQLRQAVHANAITPHYQPIVDLKTGRINGFEALARWEPSPGHFIPPTSFIELAERTGLIAELTVKLFRTACADARDWPDHVILSFNLSPTQLHDGLLGIRILTILSEMGVPPSRLEIEITESALVQDLVAAERILDDLRNAGIRIALDDFGTGYSSLGQLSRFSFDKIKIDRIFVSGSGDIKKNGKILKTIISLGKGLDILTTAEGIETNEQLRALTRMGCNLGQGYLFGKAVPANDALKMLESQAAQPQKRSRQAA